MIVRRAGRPRLGVRLLPDAPTRSGLSYAALGVLWSLLVRPEGEEVCQDLFPAPALDELIRAGYITRRGSALVVSEDTAA
mgnify:CR=1 FL=1